MVAYAKKNAAIATSVGAMLVSILLIIFFGAWAVAETSEGDFSGVLSGATAGFSGSISAQPDPRVSAANLNNAPRLATTPGSAETPADTWWGKAFLGACPLH